MGIFKYIPYNIINSLSNANSLYTPYGKEIMNIIYMINEEKNLIFKYL